jgi:GNAT superfamily N-acetyltransferase
MAAVTVRPATAADRDVLVRHALDLNNFENAIIGDRATDEAGAVASLDAALDRIARDGGIALVAEQDGRVIGHLFLTLDTAPPFIREDLRRRAWVADAFVQEAHRGQGVFHALLAEAERFATAAGCAAILIGVIEGNTRAERTYLHAGFAPYARELIKPLPAAPAHPPGAAPDPAAPPPPGGG